MAPPRPSPLTRALVAGGAALVLGGAALGVAGAQTATPSPGATATATAAATATARATATPAAQATPGATPQRPGGQLMQQFWDAVARRLGITTERLQQALSEARAEVGIPDRRPGGPGGPGGPGTERGFRGPAVRLSFDVAAQTIGVTPEQLRQELAGKSLADVARAHNVDPARVVQALRDDANRRIDQAAADGRIQADQVAPLKERTAQQIDRFVNQPVPAPGQRPGRPGRPDRPAPAPTPQSS